jgi:hypothetical protein
VLLQFFQHEALPIDLATSLVVVEEDRIRVVTAEL